MALCDPRVIKQADILVNYSLKVKKGERVIVIGDISSKPLVLEIYRQLIKAGASEVRIKFDSYEFAEIYFKEATDNQLLVFPDVEVDEMKKMDCYIRIGSSTNTRGLTSVDGERIAKRSKVMAPITDYRVEKTRWVVTRFPTESQAQEADMSLSEYENHVFDAITKTDWKNVFKDQEKLRKLIDKTRVVRIIGPQTDLTMSVAGRIAENAGGHFNMPDGEVFTSVVEDSTEGHITYTYPALYAGKEFHKVSLEFKNGKVVRATAEKGEADLNKLLNVDKGARIIGELGIGNNFQIKKFTKDILFDEKIGGTIHIALGRGYTETKSKNNSALHWDMIKDLRLGGELWFDKKMVQKNGKWLI
ncbi:aminopeptidase [Candidatus Woesebacteria bacterium]|nr:aminopeptidase [Candidatus Woesebacteria bacterium]